MSKGRARGCPYPTLNICRAMLGWAKALGGSALPRPLPYPQGPGPGSGQGLRPQNKKIIIFYTIITKDGVSDQTLSCLTSIAKELQRKR